MRLARPAFDRGSWRTDRRGWPARELVASVRIWALLGVLPGILLATGCEPAPDYPVLALDGETMGTTYSVQVVDAPTGLDTAALARRIAAALDEVNGAMSTWREDSELSRFNASDSTDWFAVSANLAEVVTEALSIGNASGGALDVTVGPLVNLWGFGPRAEGAADQVPDDRAIAAARERTGLDKLAVRLEPPALRKRHDALYVDLSAIAKGYGVDRVAAVLATEGLQNFLVEIGGELYGRGYNRHGTPWRIAVERPEPGQRSALLGVYLDGRAMATSGDYRNYFERAGTRYSHTIDPRSGRPVTHPLASVTVLAASSMTADGWATALLVLGPERGPALAETLDLAALFIVHDGDGFAVRTTPAFEQALIP